MPWALTHPYTVTDAGLDPPDNQTVFLEKKGKSAAYREDKLRLIKFPQLLEI